MRMAKGRCGRKLTYKRKIDALVASATLLRKKREADTNQFRAYKCQRCGGWHLTKKPFSSFQKKEGEYEHKSLLCGGDQDEDSRHLQCVV